MMRIAPSLWQLLTELINTNISILVNIGIYEFTSPLDLMAQLVQIPGTEPRDPEPLMLQDLPSQAHAKLVTMLEAPEWAEGGRLPAETRLATQIGVSRAVLRQALARLRSEGRIFSRRGSGNYVQPRMVVDAPAVDFARLSISTVQDMRRCMRFRQVIEGAAAEDAAQEQDVAAIDGIARAYEALRDLPAGTPVFDHDFNFHLAVASASGNAYYRVTLETLRAQIALGVEFGRRLRGLPLTEVSAQVLGEHEAVLTAIQAADPQAARAAMEGHVLQGITRLFGEPG